MTNVWSSTGDSPLRKNIVFGILGLLVCGMSPIFSAEESFTIQVHPTPVAVGEICRVALSAPVAMGTPKVLFQSKTYMMRRLSAHAYSAALPTKGLSSGEYHGQVLFSVTDQSLQLPFTLYLVDPVNTRSAGVENEARSLVMDAKTEAALKLNALESELDRVSLEKEILQQNLDALKNKKSQISDEEKATLEKRLVEKDKELSEKTAALSQAWDRVVSQEKVLRVTAKKLDEKDAALFQKEKVLNEASALVVSQNREIASRRAVLKHWEGTLQLQSSAIEAEKNVLRGTEQDLQRRQQDLQQKRGILEQRLAMLQVKEHALLDTEAALKSDQAAWSQHQSDAERILAEKASEQETREADIRHEKAVLAAEREAHDVLVMATKKDSFSLEKDRALLQQQQEKMAEQESRLMSLYQEFQSHQDRFFGLAEQLQVRMSAMEETQKNAELRSDAMALRLSQLEQINASLITPRTETKTESATENSKKKTK